ncbi:uncharacterized protein JCM10292_003173 [Rhodotorula paludigena]|uniref:uncharacterized protein n=1 Tax=Rhodotorula paludigena TaxID=86838 RepID=UPI00316C96B7
MKLSKPWNRLPSELKLLIIEMAIDDGRWEDLTRLEAILQVDRECHQLAAPIFWKSITLDERRFDTLFDLSPATRRHVRFVETEQRYASSLRPIVVEHIATRDALYRVLAQLPPLEGVDDLLAHFLTADELPFDYFAHKVLSKLTRIRLPVATLGLPVLVRLNPLHLRHLVLNLSLVFRVDLRPTFQALASFQSLTHLGLFGNPGQSILLELAQISLPLRSLRLLLDRIRSDEVQRSQIGATLTHFPTLEFVDLWLEDKGLPPPPVQLPCLRHLKLLNRDTLLLLTLFHDCPLEILDVDGLYWPMDFDRAGLINQVEHFGETLEVVILTDSFFDELSSKLHERIIRVRDECGFALIWKGESPDIWWTDLDGLDDYQVGWKRGGSGIISDEAWHG